MAKDGKIDWPQLARELGTLREIGEISSTQYAMKAIELLIGKENIRDAVDQYMSFAPGTELARSVIWHIRPWSAMEYCYEIYKSNADIALRRSAVELLRVAADQRVLPWITEFLLDPDPEIQAWGFGIVDQLLFSELVEEEDVKELIDLADQIGSPNISRQIDFVKSYLESRKRRNEILDGYETNLAASSQASDNGA